MARLVGRTCWYVDTVARTAQMCKNIVVAVGLSGAYWVNGRPWLFHITIEWLKHLVVFCDECWIMHGWLLVLGNWGLLVVFVCAYFSDSVEYFWTFWVPLQMQTVGVVNQACFLRVSRWQVIIVVCQRFVVIPYAACWCQCLVESHFLIVFQRVAIVDILADRHEHALKMLFPFHFVHMKQ